MQKIFFYTVSMIALLCSTTIINAQIERITFEDGRELDIEIFSTKVEDGLHNRLAISLIPLDMRGTVLSFKHTNLNNYQISVNVGVLGGGGMYWHSISNSETRARRNITLAETAHKRYITRLEHMRHHEWYVRGGLYYRRGLSQVLSANELHPFNDIVELSAGIAYQRSSYLNFDRYIRERSSTFGLGTQSAVALDIIYNTRFFRENALINYNSEQLADPEGTPLSFPISAYKAKISPVTFRIAYEHSFTRHFAKGKSGFGFGLRVGFDYLPAIPLREPYEHAGLNERVRSEGFGLHNGGINPWVNFPLFIWF